VKEAVYKAWSSLGGRLLEHHDVHVELSGVLFVAHVLPDGFRVEGRHSVADARHLALAVVER
jgi:4'-phosphopantetheinyl transferase EntD